MAKQSLESEFTARVTKTMRAHGAMVFAIVGGGRGAESGWPDRLVWSRQWRGLLEFKGVKTKVRAEQTLIMKELNRRTPGSAYVVRDPGDESDQVLIQDETGTRTLLRTTADTLCWDLQAMHVEVPASDFSMQEDLE